MTLQNWIILIVVIFIIGITFYYLNTRQDKLYERCIAGLKNKDTKDCDFLKN